MKGISLNLKHKLIGALLALAITSSPLLAMEQIPHQFQKRFGAPNANLMQIAMVTLNAAYFAYMHHPQVQQLASVFVENQVGGWLQWFSDLILNQPVEASNEDGLVTVVTVDHEVVNPLFEIYQTKMAMQVPQIPVVPQIPMEFVIHNESAEERNISQAIANSLHFEGEPIPQFSERAESYGAISSLPANSNQPFLFLNQTPAVEPLIDIAAEGQAFFETYIHKKTGKYYSLFVKMAKVCTEPKLKENASSDEIKEYYRQFRFRNSVMGLIEKLNQLKVLIRPFLNPTGIMQGLKTSSEVQAYYAEFFRLVELIQSLIYKIEGSGSDALPSIRKMSVAELRAKFKEASAMSARDADLWSEYYLQVGLLSDAATFDAAKSKTTKMVSKSMKDVSSVGAHQLSKSCVGNIVFGNHHALSRDLDEHSGASVKFFQEKGSWYYVDTAVPLFLMQEGLVLWLLDRKKDCSTLDKATPGGAVEYIYIVVVTSEGAHYYRFKAAKGSGPDVLEDMGTDFSEAYLAKRKK